MKAINKICPTCNKEFIATHHRAVYCSKECYAVSNLKNSNKRYEKNPNYQKQLNDELLRLPNGLVGVYEITNTVTNQRYIGTSEVPEHRWRMHQQAAIRQKSTNDLYADINTHGQENFTFKVLSLVNPKVRNTAEGFTIILTKPEYNKNIPHITKEQIHITVPKATVNIK